MDVSALVAIDVHTHVHRCTDFPMLTPERWRDDLERTAIRDEVKPGLCKHNAARLLGLRDDGQSL
jgi:hypothetical protein